MSEERIYKNIMNFLYGVPRKSVAGLALISSVFITNISFVPSANAIWVPGVGDELIPNGFPQILIEDPIGTFEEVADFDPHYSHEFGFVAPLTPIPYPIARKTWCMMQWDVLGVCLPPTLGLGKGWCDNTTGCSMTNIFNVMVTQEIKHSSKYIKKNGRLYDNSGARKQADMPDYTARDACVSGAKLSYEMFDPNTGLLKATGADRFNQKATGLVLGAKPDISSCMDTINTPKVDTPVGGNLSFAYYQNANNDPFLTTGDAPPDIYGNSDRYLTTTFFLGGAVGCPESLFAGTSLENPDTAEKWKEKASKCYDYYIFQRGTRPEWVMERPGMSTDDPLSQDAPAGNPEEAIYSSCQTLMRGQDALAVANEGASPIGKGFSPVLQYANRPDLDEADYSPAERLKKDFASTFPGKEIPQFSDLFPCVQVQTDGGVIKKTNWDTFNDLLTANYLASSIVEVSFGLNIGGPVLFNSMEDDYSYTSPGVGDESYCPNIEKINSPSNPFSPRDAVRKKPSAGDLIAVASKYSVLYDKSATKTFKTDRDYSHMTNWYGTTGRMFTMPYKFTYSGWMDPSSLTDPAYMAYFGLYTVSNGTPDLKKLADFAKYPEVQCAIVPVDILEPRREAFNNCIMQRINYNFTTYRRTNFLEFYYRRTLSDWKKPCATRFWENDSIDQCPVNMSIQQCCRIIVKDVVPMNYLKIRTCEGLRQKRRLIFGYDHIYDGKLSNIGPDNAAITAAQAALDVVQAQWDAKVSSYRARAGEYPDGISVWEKACLAIVSLGDAPVPADCIMPTNCAGETCYPVCMDDRSDNPNNDNDCPDILTKGPGGNDGGFAALWPKLEKALDDLKQAQQLTVNYDDTPVPSDGGKYIKTPTTKEEYDAVYQENQKLTLIGCDNTEPDDYRFSSHFRLSQWAAFAADLDTSIINEGMNKVQDLSNDLLNEIRDQSVTSLFNELTDEMWKIFEEGNSALDDLVRQAKKLSSRLLLAQQNIRDRVENGERAWEAIQMPEDGTALTLQQFLVLNNDPDLSKSMALTQDYALAQAELFVIAPVTAVVFEAIEYIEKEKHELAILLENYLKDGVQLVLDKREEYLLLGKTKADELIQEGVQKIQDKVNENLGSLINDLLTKLYATDETALMVYLLGEGGSHMPYMRWWDTGTSAGNPVHGGSFINTLGSYDTIIGVGHEERNFFDATTVPKTIIPAHYKCTVTELNPAHKAKLEDLENYLYANYTVCYNDGMGGQACTSTGPSRDTAMALQQALEDSFNPMIVTEVDSAIPCDNSSPNLAAYNNAKSALNNYLGSSFPPIYHTCSPCHDCQWQEGCQQAPGGPAASQVAMLGNAMTQGLEDTITSPGEFVSAAEISDGIPVPSTKLHPQQSLTTTSKMGRVGGWTELKAHQMWTTRRSNLVCLGRYEKLFKPGGQEDFVLAKAGANYVSRDGVQWPWPLGWRGYVGDPNNQFEKNLEATGLDNAKAGDIVIYTIGGMKRIAYVAVANTESDPKYVTIQSWDNSKFPTSTGSGISWGHGVDRTIFKSFVPADSAKLIINGVETPISEIDSTKVAKIGDQPSCEDPSFTSCVLGGDGNSTWDSVKIYRPGKDTERRRCPMVNYSSDAPNVQTNELSTDSFAYCVNAGFDPPANYQIASYKGVGVISDTTLCGPGWTECSSELKMPENADQIKCFPGGETCTANVVDPTPLPESESCTDAELFAAREAYEAAISGVQQSTSTANERVTNAQAALNTALTEYNNYYNANAARLAELNILISGTGASPEAAALTAATADLNAKLSAETTAVNDLNSFISNNQATMEADLAIFQAAVDPDNLTPAEQAAKDNYIALSNNLQTLQTAAGEASMAVADAQNAVAAAQAAVDALPPSGTPDPALVAERDTIQAELTRLQGIVDAARAELNAAKAEFDALFTTSKDEDGNITGVTQNDSAKVPEMQCPYPPPPYN